MATGSRSSVHQQLQPARRELVPKVGSDRILDKDMLKQLVDAIRGSGGAAPVRNRRPDQRKRGNAAHVYQNIPPPPSGWACALISNMRPRGAGPTQTPLPGIGLALLLDASTQEGGARLARRGRRETWGQTEGAFQSDGRGERGGRRTAFSGRPVFRGRRYSALTQSDSLWLRISSWRLRGELSAYGAGWYPPPGANRQGSPNPPTVAETTSPRLRQLVAAASPPRQSGRCNMSAHNYTTYVVRSDLAAAAAAAAEKAGILQGHLCHMCCLQGLLHLPVKTSAS